MCSCGSNGGLSGLRVSLVFLWVNGGLSGLRVSLVFPCVPVGLTVVSLVSGLV